MMTLSPQASRRAHARAPRGPSSGAQQPSYLRPYPPLERFITPGTREHHSDTVSARSPRRACSVRPGDQAREANTAHGVERLKRPYRELAFAGPEAAGRAGCLTRRRVQATASSARASTRTDRDGSRSRDSAS